MDLTLKEDTTGIKNNQSKKHYYYVDDLDFKEEKKGKKVTITVTITVRKMPDAEINYKGEKTDVYVSPNLKRKNDSFLSEMILSQKKLKHEPIYKIYDNDLIEGDLDIFNIKQDINNTLEIYKIYSPRIPHQDTAFYIEDIIYDDDIDIVTVYITRDYSSSKQFVFDIYITDEQYKEYEKFRNEKMKHQYDIKTEFDTRIEDKYHNKIKKILIKRLYESCLYEQALSKIKFRGNTIEEKLDDLNNTFKQAIEEVKQHAIKLNNDYQYNGKNNIAKYIDMSGVDEICNEILEKFKRKNIIKRKKLIRIISSPNSKQPPSLEPVKN